MNRELRIEDGFMPFLGHETYFRVVGEPSSDKAPLLLLHGGPGSTHNYFELLDSIALSGRQVISYDQLGCGKSYLDGHPELWTLNTWLDELEALRNHLHLDRLHILGQSWGGMMILAWLIDRQPEGVCSAILSSTLSSSRLWGHEQHRLISFMSPEDQAAIRRAEQSGDFDSEDYLRANVHYTERHACSITSDSPECLRREKRFGTESYNVAWGPNEYMPWGNLKDFDYTAQLGSITQPSLIISGTNDESTPLLAKTMYDGILNSRWELLDGARHLTFADQPERYIRIVSEWCSEHD